MPKTIPKEIKDKARKLVINGASREDAALILGVSKNNVYSWTKDIKLPRHKRTPKQYNIAKELNEKGYYIPKKSYDVNALRILKEQQGIKIAVVKGLHVGFIRGREIDALKSYLRKKRIHYITPQELGSIEKAFGIKDTEVAKESLKDNNIKLTDFL